MGTRNWYFVPFFRIRDHPHACGDKRYTTNLLKCELGSSPRVWGQVFNDLVKTKRCFIIPTRVRTSYNYACWGCGSGDHPHACGDKFHDFLLSNKLAGSSPRVWGQVLSRTYLTQSTRIIPTRVGTR